MKDVVDGAGNWLVKNWHHGICGSAAGASVMNIIPSTLKTRVSREQALALKSPAGEVRSTVTFTGFHLIYNVLQDRLARYNIALGENAEAHRHQLYIYAEWVREHVLSGDRNRKAVFRVRVDPETEQHIDVYEDGKIDDDNLTEAVLFIPIGLIATKLALDVFLRQPAASEFVLAN